MTAHDHETSRAGHRPGDVESELRVQLLRRVAHDIASPAGVIMTVIEELGAESGRPELLAMARRGIRRLLRLSEQLALAADLESGPLIPDTTTEDVRALVKDSFDQAVAVDGRRDIAASCDLGDARIVASIDRRLIGSVVRELIGNALRFASTRVSVRVLNTGTEIQVRIDDDGPGLSNEVLSALGQRFTPQSFVHGLGLSLSLAKDVLAVHGGGLRVEASTLPPGRRGTLGVGVVITLPLEGACAPDGA